jgi:hypothetical protein
MQLEKPHPHPSPLRAERRAPALREQQLSLAELGGVCNFRAELELCAPTNFEP